MTEQSHGKLRPSLPRLADVPTLPATDSERSRGRDTRGRFTASNSAANGRGWKNQIAKMVGRELKGEEAELGRGAYRLHLALLAELPSDGPAVRSLVAAQARSAVLAARYAGKATELGLDTDAGHKAIDLAVKLEQRAERLAVTAYDLATRHAIAKREARKGSNALHARILGAGAPAASQKPGGSGGNT